MNTSSDGAAPVVCSACGSQNRDGARFCVDCGSPFAERCAACGTELVPGARFCDACGAATAQAAEPPSGGELRKTVTILFADLVGSTSLQETLDTESVRRVMTRFYDTARAAIEHHEGQVVKFTGDGVMAAFGTPVVREDDALRGVRAAHALVTGLVVLNEELQRDWGVQLHLRTGVNTGEVVVGGEDGDLIGDPVNVAARLEQAAGDGEVLVGEQTERLVRRDVQLEPVDALDLKGKAEPVPAFRLVALRAQAGRGAAAETVLVGRDDELARLRAAFDGAVATRSCALVTVIGSPGIGKTRIADELARSVAAEASVLEGRCEATDGGITFAPVAEVLRSAAGIGEGDSTTQARDKLANLLPADGDRDVVVERALGVLGAVPAASTEETFWGVRRVLEALAREQPLVLVLDDVHWGQPTYLDLVEHLVEWVRDAPLLLVALARPELRELREALASGRRAADVIELDPLGAAESRTLVDELLGQVELPDALAERVLRATEGNPLFVAETVRMLVDEGVLTREGDTWVVASDSLDVEMPPTIHALIAARLERLGGDERAVVERASVIGKQFYRGAVADLCSYPVGRGIDGHLETLRRKELVQPEGTYWIDEPVFRFHHVLIRDAAYRSVLKEARAELHERFAEWLQSKAGELIGEQEEVVAFHLEQAHEYRGQLGPLDDHGRELGRRAAERLASAGRRALAREDLPAAANLLGRALDRLDDDAAERPAVLLDLAETLLSAGDTHAAATVVPELTRVAAGDERLSALASVYAAQLGYLTDSSHLKEAVSTLDADAGKLAALGDEAGVAKASHVQAGALAQLGQVGATEAALDRALAAARSAGDTRRVSAVLAGAPLAALWGPSAVVRASGRCLDVVRILRMTPGNRHLEAAALSCQAVLEAMRGRADAARSMLDGSRATFEELGLGLELLENEVHAGIVELLDDDAAAAEIRLRSAYEGFGALGAGAGTERASALLARTLLDQGRDEEADELTRISEERGGEDLKATIAWCGVRAEVLARRGEHAAAEELARRGTTMAAQTDALTDHADAQMALAAVLRAAGDAEGATGAAQRALELYREKDNQSGVRRASAFTGAEPVTAGRAALAAAPSPAPAVAAVPSGPVAGETTGVRLIRRYSDAVNARDWETAEACLTDDFVAIDHRVLATVGRERDRATFNAQTRALHDEASDLLSVIEVIADLDDVGAGRGGWSGHLNDGGGAFELPLVIVSRRRGDQFERFEIFDPDDDPGWCACLGELLGERGRAVSVGARSLEWIRARDWDAMTASYTEDATQLDRRRVGGGEIRGGEQITAFYRGLIELAPDARPHLVSVLEATPDCFLVRLDMRGHASTGGEIEVPYLLLQEVRDGLCGTLELFDVDDADAARRRFAERTRPAAPPTPRELVDRWITTYHERDWEGMQDFYDDDLRFVDHRPVGWGDSRGAEALLGLLKEGVALAPDFHTDPEMLALGHRAAVVRFLTRGHLATGGGEVETEWVFVLVSDDGRWTRAEMFEGSDAQGALERFEEIGAQTPPERLSARTCRLIRARDWDSLGAVYSDDFVMTDRRVLAWEPVHGPEAAVTLFRTWVELVPDVTVNIEAIAGDERRLVYRFTGRGHAADGGGQMEYGVILVSLTRDGRLAGSEVFDPDDEANAVARYEELRRGDTPASPRDLVDRYVAAMNAHDLEALEALFTADLRIVDHRLVGWGELQGRDSFTEVALGIWALAEDVRVSGELLAGGSAAHVGRFLFRGRLVDGGGDFEIEVVTLNVRAGEQVRQLEVFEGADVAAAFERFEEIGAVTEPERHFVRVLRLATARDWDALLEVWAPDYEGIDHRPLGWDRLHGPAAAVELSRSTVALVPDAEFRFEVLADDDDGVVAHVRVAGHADASAGGGPMQYDVAIVSLSRDGRVVRNDWFDTDAAALAHFEQSRRGRPTTPREVVDRYIELTNAQDWDGLAELYAPDLRFVDHRLIGSGELQGRDAFVDVGRGMATLTHGLSATYELVALGLAAYVARFVYRGSLIDGGGDFEIAVVAVTLVRDGQATHVEMFEPDDRETALERFEEIGAQTEPERRIARICRLANARDWESFAELWAADYEGVDHRSPSVWGVLRGPAAPVDLWRSWTEIAPDAEFRFETLASDDERIAVRVAGSGHAAESAGGGPLEYEISLVATISGGRTVRNDWFESDAAAVEHFEHVRRSNHAAPREMVTRFLALYNSRDWDGMRELFAPGLRFVDRRRVGWGELESFETLVDYFKGAIELAPDLSMDAELVAAGRDAMVTRYWVNGHLAAGGGAVEVGYVTVSLFEEGRVVYHEQFEATDAGLAFERFEEIGAATGPERLMARLCRLGMARDWEGLGDLYCEDFTATDNRALGWEPLRGRSGMADFYRSWAETVPDFVLSFELLAGDESWNVVRHGGRGHAADGGGEMEYLPIQVNRFRDGRLASAEIFAGDDEAGALARYAELRRRDHGTTPRELVERYVELHNAHEWDAMAELYTPDLRFVDHRLVGWGELEGREAFLEIGPQMDALTQDFRIGAHKLVISGAAAYVVRLVYNGRLVDGGGDFEIATLAVALYGDGQITHFDIFEMTDHEAALECFEEIGAATESERLMSRLCRLAGARDWVGLADVYADDFTGIDHRPLGWEALRGRDGIIAFYRSWAELVPDFELSFATLADDEHYSVVAHAGHGHAADGGGEMEYATIVVNRLEGGRLAAIEVFDADDHAAALARYEELRAGS